MNIFTLSKATYFSGFNPTKLVLGLCLGLLFSLPQISFAYDGSNPEEANIENSIEVAGLNLFVTSKYETCIGSNDAKSTVIASGGEEPYTYEWSDGQTDFIAYNLGAGPISVTVTDATGCTAVENEVVELSPEGLWIMLSSTDASCGASDGTIHVGVMTGIPPYSYVWSNSNIPDTADPVDLAAGTYSVTVTDANDCTAVESIDVESNSNISISITATNVTCDQLGSATVNISGGNGPYTISWNTNDSGTSISNLDPGMYSVEVVDANGCSGSATVLIEDTCNDDCKADAGTLTAGANPGCVNGTATISATGNGDDEVPQGYSKTYILTSGVGLVIQEVNSSPTFDVSSGGVYTIHTFIYDPNTFDLNTITIGTTTGFDVNSSLIQGGGDICASLDIAGASFDLDEGFEVNITPGTASICPFGDLQLGTNLSGTTYLYDWSATGGNFSNTSSANPTYTMGMPGTYTISVTVTNAAGCESTSTSTVTVQDGLSVSINPSDAMLCGGGAVDFTVAGGSGNDTYEWTANGGSFDNSTSSTPSWTMMIPGTYQIAVTVTSASGCSGTAQTIVTVGNGPSSCSAIVTSSYNEGVAISTLGGADGSASASANGTPPLSYAWSNGETGASIDGLSAGTYDVTISDDNGCTCTSSVTLEDPAKLGNYVWHDLNQDGIQDPNEPGIADVKVTLTGTAINGADVMRMLFTDASGMYMFDGLLPGTYKVTFGQPNGFTSTGANAGSDDALDSDADPATGMTQMVDLGAGEYNPTLDAGFYQCTSVGNYVWHDENHNGIQDANEAGVAGVTVKLVRAGWDQVFCTDDDVIVTQTTTDANGLYLFECVDPMEYIISFMDIPADWMFTGQNQGGSDENDSDANNLGKTDPFTVTSGSPDNLTIDAGIRPICNNFTFGGQIIGSTQPLCPGDTPAEILSVLAPTGGSGPIEYLWLFTTSADPFSPPVGYTEIPNSNTPNFQPGPLNVTTSFVRCVRRLDCPAMIESNVVTFVVDPCPGPVPFTINGTVNINDQVELDWSMKNELDDYKFYIEKSTDGKNYSEVGSMKSKGLASNNEYSFMDKAPSAINHYRVKMVGLHSGISYSNEIQLEVSDEILVQVYPNPFSEKLILTPMQELQDEVTIELFNDMGQRVYTGTFPKTSDKIEIDLDAANDVRNLVLRVSHTNLKKQKITRIMQIKN